MRVLKEEKTEVHVYSAGRHTRGVSLFRSLIREFPAAHALGYRLAERNIRARYRQSALGILWAFFPPLATALVWIILYSSNVVKLGDVGVSYPLFVITGTITWSVFSNAVLMPMQTVQANRGILVKINFPREAILINAFYEIAFNTLITFVIIAVELLVFRVGVTWQSLLFIPGVFLLLLLGVSLGLLLLPFSVLYKDIQFALPSVLQFAMYITPVVYARPAYTGATRILSYNPVSHVLTTSRACLLGLDTVSPGWQIGAIAGATLVLLLIGVMMQRLTIEILIERMGG
jgi:lipopolysaccharide transport system permease protein